MFNAYMNDTVTQLQYKGQDAYGTDLARTTVTLRAHIDYRGRQVTSETGSLVMAAGKLYLPLLTIVRTSHASRATATIAYEDVLVVDGLERLIIQINRARDFSARALEVYFV